MDVSLTPSLWRTCRALANMNRLRLFCAMIDKPPQTVCSLARSCGLSDSHASQFLRQLNARGLCAVMRKSRWVFYHIEADPKVRHAHTIVQALVPALRGDTPQSHQDAFAALTAYTHPRRIAIVYALASCKSIRCAELCSLCAISGAAMERHLGKLERRGIVAARDDVISLARPVSSLARTLLAIATER